MTVTETANANDLSSLYKHLRVVDVVDAMDDRLLQRRAEFSQEDPASVAGDEVLGPGGDAQRCVPANKPMWKLDNTKDIVNAHGIWFEKMGYLKKGRGLMDLLQPGSVLVTDVGSTNETGFFGSENVFLGIQGGGGGRDRDQRALPGHGRSWTMQRTPMACSRARGRTIIPGRIEVVELNTTIGIGGAQVRPGRYRRLRR